MKEFERGSAAIDWCEDNYAVVASIAEFYNVVSNALFLLMPPLLLYLFRQYARQVNPSVNIMWVLLMVVGASSVYFHTTLSMFGQLLDEIAIIWVVWCGIALWYPKRYYPSQLNGNRKYFKICILLGCLSTTALACIHPAVNSYFMFMFVPPSVYMLYLELQR
ncbi:alkaline ceramidase-like [Amphiura filiformis]|uniref:alkaline ceramidase-like n=1 Tax=Amphiura filiformis TaxID=82378 RepID=UPI003B21F071